MEGIQLLEFPKRFDRKDMYVYVKMIHKRMFEKE